MECSYVVSICPYYKQSSRSGCQSQKQVIASANSSVIPTSNKWETLTTSSISCCARSWQDIFEYKSLKNGGATNRSSYNFLPGIRYARQPGIITCLHAVMSRVYSKGLKS